MSQPVFAALVRVNAWPGAAGEGDATNPMARARQGARGGHAGWRRMARIASSRRLPSPARRKTRLAGEIWTTTAFVATREPPETTASSAPARGAWEAQDTHRPAEGERARCGSSRFRAAARAAHARTITTSRYALGRERTVGRDVHSSSSAVRSCSSAAAASGARAWNARWMGVQFRNTSIPVRRRAVAERESRRFVRISRASARTARRGAVGAHAAGDAARRRARACRHLRPFR